MKAGDLMYNSLEHRYSFAASGLKMKDKIYCSRQEANEEMYRIIKKYNLRVLKVYEDNHDKTYVCDNGVVFYIHRA